MLEHTSGLDHVMITVRNLDNAAEQWRRLGFTLSPRGIHSAHLGSANYTIMLDPDYIELLGILVATPNNQIGRDFLDRREGIERGVFRAIDTIAGIAELQARGISVTGPNEFSRPVDLPDGTRAEAKFRTFDWPVADAPADLRIFACQHLTPEAVWVPALQQHANTAKCLERVEILARDPAQSAQHMARLIDGVVTPEADGALAVSSGVDRARFVFLTHQQLLHRHPGIVLDSLPQEGAITLGVKVHNLERARDCLGMSGATLAMQRDHITVSPHDTSGVIVQFI